MRAIPYKCIQIWTNPYKCVHTKLYTQVWWSLKAETCNFTKISTPPWVFFTFFKLYKWYQIAQRNANTHNWWVPFAFSICIHWEIFFITEIGKSLRLPYLKFNVTVSSLKCGFHLPANIYLFKVNNRTIRKMCEICSKLTIKTPFHTFFYC